jgi:hypothetical protein
MWMGWRSTESCMCCHDVEEVLKIWLSGKGGEDCLAWHHERSDIFTVKSAYKLPVTLDKSGKRQLSSSTHEDGARPLYNEIWTAKVLAKVCIFAWRLKQDDLATQVNRKRRTLIRNVTCMPDMWKIVGIRTPCRDKLHKVKSSEIWNAQGLEFVAWTTVSLLTGSLCCWARWMERLKWECFCSFGAHGIWEIMWCMGATLPQSWARHRSWKAIVCHWI